MDGPRSSIAGVGTNRTACKQAGPGTYSRAWPWMAYGRADRSACRGSESGAGNSPGYRAVLCRLLWGNPNLLLRVVPAYSFFAHE